MVCPGYLLLPLCPPALLHHGDPPAGTPPALLDKVGALLLVLLLSVGNAADRAVGGAFVGVLIWQLLFLPAASILGQCPTEAAP